MSKPTPLSGYPEFLPAERTVEREVVASISRTFELHGFANIETRAVEPLERLSKGGEIDKELYVLRRLHAEDSDADSGLGLHFDLTVPFARYVLENAGKLEFPFRRYQIQPAWRGERPQEGRYRQFNQADIDIVGRDELPFHHDVEVVRVMVEALGALPLPALSFQVNNRKLIQGFYRGWASPTTRRDPRDRQARQDGPPTAYEALLVETGRRDTAGGPVPRAGGGPRRRRVVRRPVLALGVTDPLLDDGLADLVAVEDGAHVRSTHVAVDANLHIARGLDYYTGTVLEGWMASYGD